MPETHPSRRAGRTATTTLVVLGVAGTIVASGLAYADSHSGSGAGTGSSETTTSSSQDTAPAASGQAPQLGTGSGPVHAQSSGS